MKILRYIELLLYLILFSFIYFVNVPEGYQRYPYTENIWTIDALGPAASAHTAYEHAYPAFRNRFFHSENILFFYDEKGNTGHRLRLDGNTLVTASVQNYITYQKVGKQIALFDNTGSRQWIMETYAYPVLSESGNRFVLFTTDTAGFKYYDLNCNLLYEKQYLDIMTTDFSFCPFNNNLAVGSSGGKIHIIDYTGKELFSHHVSASKYNIIKTVEFSYYGEYIAAVSGLYPEVIMLFNTKGKILWKRETGLSRRTRVSVHIDHANNLFLEGGTRSLIVRNLKNGHILYEISLDRFGFSRIRYIKFASAEGTILALVTTDKDQIALCFSPGGKNLWTGVFKDMHFLKGEVADSGNSFLIHTSKFAAAYRFIK